jgi:hypothetical protein
MVIDLTKIKSVWLTCEKCKDRWPRMEEMLLQLEIPAKMVVGRESKPYTIAVAESHLKALEESGDDPILIIEDDASVLADFRSIIEIPDDCDAIYLGTSLYGMNFGVTQFNGVVAKNEGEYLRVFNELSMHCILYVSRDYKDHIIKLLKNFNGIGGVDDKIASEASNWKTLAVKRPWFYQADLHSEQATMTPITPIF